MKVWIYINNVYNCKKKSLYLLNRVVSFSYGKSRVKKIPPYLLRNKCRAWPASQVYYHLWANENPHSYVETGLHPQKIGIWFPVLCVQVVGLFFFMVVMSMFSKNQYRYDIFENLYPYIDIISIFFKCPYLGNLSA